MLPSWTIPAGRAVLALVLGVAIAFSTGHTAAFGLVVFGGYAVLAGALLLVAWFGPRAPTEARATFRAQGAVTLVAGVAALAQPGGGMAYLVWVLSGWAIVTGALEATSGIRFRGRVAAWADWLATGLLTLVLGAIVLILPPDFVQEFVGEKGVTGVLTSGIVVVGLLGAWGIVTGVLQAISAVTPLLGHRRTAPAGQRP